MASYSFEIWEKLVEQLEKLEMHSVFLDREKGRITFPMNISDSIRFVDYIVRIGDDDYCVSVIFPLAMGDADLAQKHKMAEFLSRANFGLRNGNFEFDFDDGEIRYKCFVDCEEQLPGEEIIKNSLFCPASMFDRYGPGILQVMFHDADPKEAVERCEGRHGSAGILGHLPQDLREKILALAEERAQTESGDDSPADDAEGGVLSYDDFMELQEDEDPEQAADAAEAASGAEDETM